MQPAKNRVWASLLCSAALPWIASNPVLAAEPLAPMRVVQVGEVQYISGGASRAERAELNERTVDFRLQVNFTAKGSDVQPNGVTVKLIRRGEAARAIKLTTAGPLLLVNMPSGTYTLSASLHGAAPVESKFELEPGELEKIDIQLDAPNSCH